MDANTTTRPFGGAQPKPRESPGPSPGQSLKDAPMNSKGVEGVPLSGNANYAMGGFTDADMKRGYCDEGKVGSAAKSDKLDPA